MFPNFCDPSLLTYFYSELTVVLACKASFDAFCEFVCHSGDAQPGSALQRLSAVTLALEGSVAQFLHFDNLSFSILSLDILSWQTANSLGLADMPSSESLTLIAARAVTSLSAAVDEGDMRVLKERLQDLLDRDQRQKL